MKVHFIPAGLRATNEGSSVAVAMTIDTTTHKVLLRWISAWAFLREMEMCVSFGQIQWREQVAAMFRKEEARRQAKEAKTLAKEWREFAAFWSDT